MSTVADVVREICLGMPETEETLGHGMPNFKVAGKTFATYSVTHQGDGKVALLLNISLDMQKMLVESVLGRRIPPHDVQAIEAFLRALVGRHPRLAQ